MGIEPTQSAWKAEILPLNYTRKSVFFIKGRVIILLKPFFVNDFFSFFEDIFQDFYAELL